MSDPRHRPVLSPSDMALVDADMEQSGVAIFAMMRRAGFAVAAGALRHFPEAVRFVVFCGPGNNGGDGWIAAAALRDAGAAVAVYSLVEQVALKGAAAEACRKAGIASGRLDAYAPALGDVVIDALFGAGLSRPVSPVVAALIDRVAKAKLPVLAVDLPSGMDGRSGAVHGACFAARHTITFAALKTGHLLMPGRALCGAIEIADIGIPERIIRAHASGIVENTPCVWAGRARAHASAMHKYTKGHVGVLSGGALATGAARLSALAALHSGAGLVTIGGDGAALAVHASHLTAIMLKEIADADALAIWIEDKRINAFVLGPGFGAGDTLRAFALTLRDRALVLDADGFTSFAQDPQPLFDAFAGEPVRLVLTPHDGEFRRMFPDIAADPAASKVDKALAAARRGNAVVVSKGADSVIAAPDGRVAINGNAPAWLATAGSGDVLAGIIAAHLAHGMPAFEAAAAGVWRHGQAGTIAGEGLTAETLVDHLQPLQ